MRTIREGMELIHRQVLLLECCTLISLNILGLQSFTKGNTFFTCHTRQTYEGSFKIGGKFSWTRGDFIH